MKKLLLSILACAFFLSASAQFTKGTILAGASSNFNTSFTTEKYKSGSTTTTQGKTTSLTFTPEAAYFIMDNLAVGGAISWTSSSFKPDGGGSTNTSSTFLIGPVARYYFLKGLFAQGTLLVGSEKDSNYKYSVTTWSLGAGYAAFITDAVAVEPSLSYGSYAKKQDGNDGKDITSGLSINLGFAIYLNKK